MMTDLRLVTVTLNPALDMTGNLAELRQGNVNLVTSSTINPGGKGINVAKVLAELGAEITVTGFLGEENQDPFQQLFKKNQIDDQFIRVDGASRINVKLVEHNSDVTDLNFPGVLVTVEQIEALEKKLFQLAETHQYFVIAGSLPNGMPTSKLTEWIQCLRAKGKKVIFDASQQALIEGLKAIPWLVKPNEEELAQWAGSELESEQQLLDLGDKLAATGIENIVISRGADGVLWRQGGVWLSSKPPMMTVASTVGAGDSLVAGMCWAEMNGWDRQRALSFATALSAHAVTQTNVGVDDVSTILALEQKVITSQIQKG